MNVFELRDHLVADYSSYVRSFVRIKDRRIRERVAQELDEGLLWPDPLIQLNPSFEPGKWLEELVEEGVLHPDCAKIFHINKSPDSSDACLLFSCRIGLFCVK